MGPFHICYMEDSGEHVTPANQRNKSVFENTSGEAHLTQRNVIPRYVCASRQEWAPKARAPVRKEPGFWRCLFKSTEICGEECTDDKLTLPFSVGWRRRSWAQTLAVFKYCDFFSYKDGSYYFLKHVVSMVHT